MAGGGVGTWASWLAEEAAWCPADRCSACHHTWFARGEKFRRQNCLVTVNPVVSALTPPGWYCFMWCFRVQCGTLHPLAFPGPSLYVKFLHLGTSGLSFLRVGSPIRVQLRVGRALITQRSLYCSSLALSDDVEPLAVPLRSTPEHSAATSQPLYVYVYPGSSNRWGWCCCVFQS
jgi:hypothetical protein